MGVSDVNVIVQYLRSVTTLGPFLTGVFFGVLLCWLFLRERLQLFGLRLEDRDREIQVLRTQIESTSRQVLELMQSVVEARQDFKKFLQDRGNRISDLRSEINKMQDTIKRAGGS